MLRIAFVISSMSLVSMAYADGTTAAGVNPQAPNPMTSMIPFAIIFAIFYFMMIRPQKKRMQEEQAMLGALTRGDEVVTKSGLLGTIAGLSEKVVTLEVSDGVKIKCLRDQIAGKAKKFLEEKTEEKSEAKK